MFIRLKIASLAACATFALCALLGLAPRSENVASAAEEPKSSTSVTPVEGDMHEFMEYVFQPTYKRLKASLAKEPADNAAWKGIKSDALILAEGGNLLLLRQPKENGADWKAHSAASRDFGGELYRAAKKKDFKSARTHYEAMLTKCNACHQQFAHGEHQLSP